MYDATALSNDEETEANCAADQPMMVSVLEIRVSEGKLNVPGAAYEIVGETTMLMLSRFESPRMLYAGSVVRSVTRVLLVPAIDTKAACKIVS